MDKDKEIEDLERKRDVAWLDYLQLCIEVNRLKQKPITKEERAKSLEQCRNIAKNVGVK